MSAKLFLEYTEFAVLVLASGNLLLMRHKRALKKFAALTSFLFVVILGNAISIPLLFFRTQLGISAKVGYPIYIYSQIMISALEAALMIAIIYNVFSIAMRPLPGLHKLGRIVFRWVACVSLIFALVIALGPHLLANGNARIVAISSMIGRTQEGLSVLILCLLLFVCFSTKTLGLTYRSHIFGVSLGLGVIASFQLVQAAWYSTTQAQSIYSPMYIVGILGTCVAFLVWGVYFAVPEPKRKMILLPTTSPFFFWNRLSEAMGASPGQVAIGFNPSMIAPAEMKVMAAMSKAAREREARELAEEAQLAEVSAEPVALAK